MNDIAHMCSKCR